MMKMIDVYLAGPMRGYPDNNRAAFNESAGMLRKKGYVVFNTADIDAEGGTLPEMLAKDVAWILREAEAVVLIPGWERSAGAKAEVMLAHAVGIPVFEFENFYPNGERITRTWEP
jgi:nucleoside 2-deoxyribosyltransferase